MANYLASIFGTEQDKVNCSFYYKIGACRHGDRCSRKHVKPSYSQTILLPNLYQNPAYDPKNKMNPQQMQMHFDAFYEDIWCELCQYGLVEELVVCDNNNDRMSPKFYVTTLLNCLLTCPLQISSVTFTSVSSTKKTPKKPATP
jgi:splicing factor U2AF subunit